MVIAPYIPILWLVVRLKVSEVSAEKFNSPANPWPDKQDLD